MTGKEITKPSRRDLARVRGHTDFMPDVKAAAMLDVNPWAGNTLVLLMILLAVAYFWASTQQCVAPYPCAQYSYSQQDLRFLPG